MHRSFFPWKSLKARVTIFTLAIFVISIWALAFYANRILHLDFERHTGEQQRSVVTFVAAEINKELEERIQILETVGRAISQTMLGDRAALQKMLEQDRVLQGHFNAGLLVLSQEGMAIADVPVAAGRRGISYADNEANHVALTEGKSAISGPMVGRKLKQPLFNIAAPIRDADGKIIGALVGVINLALPNFLDTIGKHRYGKSGGYLVIDPKHRLIVTATDKSRVMQPTPAPGTNWLFDKRMQGFNEPGVAVNSLGVENLSSTERIPVAGWFVVAALPTQEAFATIHDLMQRIEVGAILLTLLAGGLTWWMLTRQLAPVLAAAKTLTTLSASHEPAQFLPVAQQDEIGQLIGGFNRMLETLRDREEALKQSEFRLKFALEGSGDGLWDWNLADGGLYLTKRWKEMFGLSEDEIGAGIDEWEKRIHPEDKQHTLAALRGYLDGNFPSYISEHRIRCKDGSYKWILDRGVVVNRGDDGSPLRMIGTYSDISERKQAAEQLRWREERFRNLFEGASDGIMTLEPNGNIVAVNESFARMHGYSAEEMRCMSLKELDTPETARLVPERMRRILEGEAMTFEVEHYHKDGHVLSLDVSASLVTTEGGRIIQCIHRDMTGRKHAEEELLRQKNLLNTIFESTSEAIFAKDVDGRYCFINEAGARMLARRAIDVLGRTDFDLIPAAAALEFRKTDEQVMSGGQVYEKEESGVIDGRTFIFQASKSPWRDNAGKTIGVIGVSKDITLHRLAEAERARLEVQLRESQKMEALGTLAGGVAHDFNNIIAAIMGNVELARQDAGPENPAQQSLEEIRKASQRAKNLVQQILAFGRRQVTEREVMSLAPVVQEATALLRATIPAGVRLIVECAADTPPVLADATQIEQVVLNLCSNAWHAVDSVEREGVIEVRLQPDERLPGQVCAEGADIASGDVAPGRYACLTVRDNGVGMDKKTMERVFEPFFTTKPAGKGTGIGMAVVYGIVQEHGANIEVHSVCGEGTTFRVYFPTAPAALAPTPGSDARAVISSAGAAPESSGSGKHVLYVDDDESIVFLMTRMLERQGYRVSAYVDPKEALAAARANPDQYDIAVTDFNMPGMSGLALATALREIRPDLPVLLASGYITEELRRQAPAAGVRELMYKPNTADELFEAVARFANAQYSDRSIF